MGFYINQIGFKHNLPIDDPVALAQTLAKRFDTNIQLWYPTGRIVYDPEKQYVFKQEDEPEAKCDFFRVNDSDSYMCLSMSSRWIRDLQEQIGIENLNKVQYEKEWIKDYLAEDITERELYSLSGQGLYIEIYKEMVSLDWEPPERYSALDDLFASYREEDKKILREYREELYERAKLFGCDEVVLFYSTEENDIIYKHLNLSPEALKNCIYSRSYILANPKIEEEQKRVHLRLERIIQYNDCLTTGMDLAGGFIGFIFVNFKEEKYLSGLGLNFSFADSLGSKRKEVSVWSRIKSFFANSLWSKKR